MKLEIGKKYHIKSRKPNRTEVTGILKERGNHFDVIVTEEGEKILLVEACIISAELVKLKDPETLEVEQEHEQEQEREQEKEYEYDHEYEKKQTELGTEHHARRRYKNRDQAAS